MGSQTKHKLYNGGGGTAIKQKFLKEHSRKEASGSFSSCTRPRSCQERDSLVQQADQEVKNKLTQPAIMILASPVL